MYKIYMLIKLLNGDLISLDDTLDSTQIIRAVAKHLEVYPEQVKMMSVDTNDTNDITHLAIVSPVPVLELRAEAFGNLPVCVLNLRNDSVRQFVDAHHALSKLAQTHGDPVILSQAQQTWRYCDESVLENINFRDQYPVMCTGLSLNRNDAIVDFFLSHPTKIVYPVFLANPHPRAVAHNIEYLQRVFSFSDDNVSVDHMLYLKWVRMNTNADMFWWAWRNLPRPETDEELFHYIARVDNGLIVKFV